MRVAIAIHEYPPVGGGAATAAAQTARALAGAGHDVLVVTGGVPGLPREQRADGITIARLPALRLATLAPSALELISFTAGAALLLERRLRAFAAEGVIAYFAVPVGPFAVRAARRLGIPAVVSLRGSDVPGFRHGRLDGPLAAAVARPVIRWTLGQADAVAPNSDVLRDLALAFMPELHARIHVVPNGIEEESIASAPAASGRPSVQLIQVGQLIERKRVALTLEALAHLPDIGLTLIGDGPQRAELERRAAALGLAERVRFTGHQPRSSILEQLRRHDLFVMTSVAEGMSNALLEAMAAGLPVITTPSGSHDLVERAGCGLVLQRDDPAALAAAITDLAADAGRRSALGRAAIAHARTLTWTACATRFTDLLAAAEPGYAAADHR